MQQNSFFPTMRASLLTGVAMAGLLIFANGAQAQDPGAQDPSKTSAVPAQTDTKVSDDGKKTTTTTTTVDTTGKQTQSTKTSYTFGRGKKKADSKDAKVLQTKDTKKELRKEQKGDALVGADSKLPDKQLYDKSIAAMKKGHFDVARLDLQTMLNTYPESQYQMRAKLAIADSWYNEGGTAALTQAEQEYRDFTVFFPNVPEAGEAQMRIGDIYFKQMDRPDRDYAKAIHAEEEYRRMLTDYPNAPAKLTMQAKQKLREVQEVLASREADIASYYAAKENWAAAIARYQTVVDTYPLYSHMDDTLVGLGDAYEAQARYIRSLKMPATAEAGKAKLEQEYDGLAAAQYEKVVLEHSAAQHVEDARDRLEAMGRPIPVPTAEQAANSAALENSRSTYNLTNRVSLMFLHKPDTVTSARVGEPMMADPKPMTAPAVVKRVNEDFRTAFAPPGAATPPVTNGPTTGAEPPAASAAVAAPAATTPAAPLAFVPVGTGEDSGSGSTTLTAAPAAGSRTTGASVGIEIVKPGTPDAAPATVNTGLPSVGPTNNAALPPVVKAAAAPDAVNDIPAGTATPAAQAAPAKGKAAKPEFDKADESSSKHKKKKGIKKLDPLPQ